MLLPTVLFVLLATAAGSQFNFIFKNGRHFRDNFKLKSTSNIYLADNPHVTIDYISQKLDHFSLNDNRVWNQVSLIKAKTDSRNI